MGRMRLIRRIRQNWRAFTIKKKIALFTAIVFASISLSILFNILITKFSMVDFGTILNENYKCNEYRKSLETEIKLFEQYVKSGNEETKVLLDEAIERTRNTVYDLNYDYTQIGEERYAYTWSIRNSYEVYAKQRDSFLNGTESQVNYIERLYELYDMQLYLQKYGNELMDETIADSSKIYQEKIPSLVVTPWIVIVFGTVLMIIMAGLAKAMNRAIVAPVTKLADASRKIAANEFQIEDVTVDNKDELGDLVQAFNKMKYSTREYIMAMEENRATLDKLHHEEVQRLEAERRVETMRLEALRNQINPHFLFNTLNVIGGMAMLENAETTGQMIKALSSLFRYNLQNSETDTALFRELKIIRDYMYIQQMRFGDRIHFEIECDVDEEQVKIPTFILQPLVENAVIHGLAKKEEGGTINIRIWEDGKNLEISVKDTGIGMSKEELDRVQARMEEDYTHSNIGLGNIYRRIKLMHPGSKMIIKSIEGKGTEIHITILR